MRARQVLLEVLKNGSISPLYRLCKGVVPKDAVSFLCGHLGLPRGPIREGVSSRVARDMHKGEGIPYVAGWTQIQVRLDPHGTKMNMAFHYCLLQLCPEVGVRIPGAAVHAVTGDARVNDN